MGFDGVELRGLGGEQNLLEVSELTAQPDEVRRKFQDENVELVCLSTSATLASWWIPDLARQQAEIAAYLQLAEQLGCPYVRIPAGRIQQVDNRRVAISRIADSLTSMVPVAVGHHVTLLVENSGDFPASEDLWFLIDAAGHPAVQCCWNQCAAMTVRERPTVSIPRLVSRIGLVHVCDAVFSDQGLLRDYKPLGQGNVEIDRQIELLKGLLFDGYLVVDWPKASVDTLPEPQPALAKAAEFLREGLAAERAVLSAYKGDKRPIKMAPRRRRLDRPTGR